MTRVFDTTSLDEAVDVLNQLYGSIRLKPAGERYGLRIDQEAAGDVVLNRAAFTMEASIRADPLGAFCIAHVRSGAITYTHDPGHIPMARGDVGAVSRRPDQRWGSEFENTDIEFAMIPQQVMDDVAGSPDEPVRLRSVRPTSAAAAARWIRAYDSVRRLVADVDVRTAPLVGSQAGRLLAATALTAFPTTARLEPTSQDRRDARPPTVRRAVAFIEANPERDLTVADIARAASVTSRGIQLAFRLHLDTTPMAYLRRVRLDRAHADLLAARPDQGETVSDIAYRWGFGSASRFSSLYRAEYGQVPSRTLHA